MLPGILHIENDSLSLKGTEIMLKANGYAKTYSALNLNEASKILQSNTIHIVIVALDRNEISNTLPFLKKTKWLFKTAVVCTSNPAQGYIEEAFELNPDAFIIKPFSEIQLLTSIKMIWHKQVSKIEKEREIKNILTTREVEIFKLIKQGETSRAIANTFSISVNTVKNHRAAILRKLNVSNSTKILLSN